MAEPGSSVALENLNLNIDVNKARPETGLSGLVGATERQLRLGRMSESEIGGVFGAVEDVAKFFGAEVGMSQQSSEMKAFGKALKEPGANDVLQSLFKSELEGKTPEEQAEFLSGGMGSLKEVALKLMSVRSEAPELNGGVISDELSKLATEYRSATAEDKKAINGFMAEMLTARKDTINGLNGMWQAQEDMDIVNRVKESLDLGNRDVAPHEEYEFKMVGGTMRKVVSWAKRAMNPATTLRRSTAGFRRAAVRDKQETWARLDQLKAKALSIGGEVEDVSMWKAGIISTKELGKVNIDKLLAEKVLTANQADILREGRERKSSLNKDGKFVRVSEAKEHAFYEKFFGERMSHSEDYFRQAREKYLKFDIENLKDESTFDLLKGTAGVGVDLAPLPRWFKSGVAKAGSLGARGVITVATGTADAVQFGVDRVEAVIAGDALEKMTAIALSRKMVTDKFNGMLKSGEVSDKDLLTAAKEVRGGWSVFERESALYASRAADTVSMTEGESLPVSALLAPAEMAEAGIDWATGGVFFGENTARVATELKQVISQSVDGNGVMQGIESRGVEHTSESKVVQWLAEKAQEFKIPEQYQTMAKMKEFLRTELHWGGAIEKFRQAVGPEAKLPFGLDKLKDQEWWEVIAGGSKRVSVEQVSNKVKTKLSRVEDGIGSGVTGVEAATLVVLKDALQKHASVELKQVGERARLDKMEDQVLRAGAAGVLVAGMWGLSEGVAAIAGPWSEHAHVALQKASAELSRLQTEFAKIPDIVSQTHQEWATESGQSHIFWQKVGVFWNEAVAGTAGGADWLAPKAALVTKVGAALAPVIMAGRSALGLIGIKPRTKLFAPTGEVK